MTNARKLLVLVLSSCSVLGLLAACGDGREARKTAAATSTPRQDSVDSLRYFLLDGMTPTRLSADGGGTETGAREGSATSLRNNAGVRARVTVLGEVAVTEVASLASPVVSIGQDDGSSAVVYADFGGGVQAAVTISADPAGQAAATGRSLVRELTPINPDRLEDGMTATRDSGFEEVARRPAAASTTAGPGGSELVAVGGVEVSLEFRKIAGSTDLDVLAAPMVAPIEAAGGREIVVLDNGDATGTGSFLVFVDGGYQVTLSGPTTADRLRELVGSVKSVDRAAWEAAVEQAYAQAKADPADLVLADGQVGTVRVWLGGSVQVGIACSDGAAGLANRCSYLAGASPIVVRVPSTDGSLVLACDLGQVGDVTSASVNGADVPLRSIDQCTSAFLVRIEADEVATVTLHLRGSTDVPDPEYTTVLPAEAPLG